MGGKTSQVSNTSQSTNSQKHRSIQAGIHHTAAEGSNCGEERLTWWRHLCCCRCQNRPPLPAALGPAVRERRRERRPNSRSTGQRMHSGCDNTAASCGWTGAGRLCSLERPSLEVRQLRLCPAPAAATRASTACALRWAGAGAPSSRRRRWTGT
jgi:hypothetical protein